MGSLHGALAEQARVVGSHERAHVTAFRKTLGRAAVKSPSFNFRGEPTAPSRSGDRGRVRGPGRRGLQGAAAEDQLDAQSRGRDLDPLGRGPSRRLDPVPRRDRAGRARLRCVAAGPRDGPDRRRHTFREPARPADKRPARPAFTGYRATSAVRGCPGGPPEQAGADRAAGRARRRRRRPPRRARRAGHPWQRRAGARARGDVASAPRPPCRHRRRDSGSPRPASSRATPTSRMGVGTRATDARRAAQLVEPGGGAREHSRPRRAPRTWWRPTARCPVAAVSWVHARLAVLPRRADRLDTPLGAGRMDVRRHPRGRRSRRPDAHPVSRRKGGVPHAGGYRQAEHPNADRAVLRP